MTQRFTTRRDAIEQDIAPALGDEARDFDMDRICDAAYCWRIDTDDCGNELLNTGGYEKVVDDAVFWDIVRQSAF